MSRARIVAVWWIACLLWSCGWLFLKIGLSDLPPITFAGIRFALAGGVLFAIECSGTSAWGPSGDRPDFV